jgi:hypothetical protein
VSGPPSTVGVWNAPITFWTDGGRVPPTASQPGGYIHFGLFSHVLLYFYRIEITLLHNNFSTQIDSNNWNREIQSIQQFKLKLNSKNSGKWIIQSNKTHYDWTIGFLCVSTNSHLDHLVVTNEHVRHRYPNAWWESQRTWSYDWIWLSKRAMVVPQLMEHSISGTLTLKDRVVHDTQSDMTSNDWSRHYVLIG